MTHYTKTGTETQDFANFRDSANNLNISIDDLLNMKEKDFKSSIKKIQNHVMKKESLAYTFVPKALNVFGGKSEFRPSFAQMIDYFYYLRDFRDKKFFSILFELHHDLIEIKSKSVEKERIRLLKSLKDQCYVWKLEYNKSKKIHLHVLTTLDEISKENIEKMSGLIQEMDGKQDDLLKFAVYLCKHYDSARLKSDNWHEPWKEWLLNEQNKSKNGKSLVMEKKRVKGVGMPKYNSEWEQYICTITHYHSTHTLICSPSNTTSFHLNPFTINLLSGSRMSLKFFSIIKKIERRIKKCNNQKDAERIYKIEISYLKMQLEDEKRDLKIMDFEIIQDERPNTTDERPNTTEKREVESMKQHKKQIKEKKNEKTREIKEKNRVSLLNRIRNYSIKNKKVYSHSSHCVPSHFTVKSSPLPSLIKWVVPLVTNRA